MLETNGDIAPQSREIDQTFYSKEPKSVTSFNSLTLFLADINQSEVEDSFQLASYWIKSVRKNVNTVKTHI